MVDKENATRRIRPLRSALRSFWNGLGQNILGHCATERIIRVWLALFTTG